MSYYQWNVPAISSPILSSIRLVAHNFSSVLHQRNERLRVSKDLDAIGRFWSGCPKWSQNPSFFSCFRSLLRTSYEGDVILRSSNDPPKRRRKTWKFLSAARMKGGGEGDDESWNTKIGATWRENIFSPAAPPSGRQKSCLFRSQRVASAVSASRRPLPSRSFYSVVFFSKCRVYKWFKNTNCWCRQLVRVVLHSATVG